MNTVVYRTTKCVECQCDSEVYICLDVALTASGLPFIEAFLTRTLTSQDECGRIVCAHYLEYNEAQLLNPQYSLVNADIGGVICRGCLTEFIEATVAVPVSFVAGVCFVSNDADFAAALAAPGCNHIVTVGSFAMGANRTLPTDKNLTCLRNCPIDTNGFTLTINGSFASGPHSCFLTGGVVFNAGSIEQAYPQWFGATGDNATDDTAALQLTIDSLASAGRTQIKIIPGIYRHTGINLDNNVSLIGVAPKTCILRYTPGIGDAITLTNNAATTGSRYCAIVDIKLDCLTTSSGAGISGPADPLVTADIFIERYEIEGYLKGIYIPYGLHVYVGFGRLIGQGQGVAGGIGIQLGDRALVPARLVNIAEIEGAYVSSYAFSFWLDGSIQQLTHVTSEDADNAIHFGGRVAVIGSWIQATTFLVESTYNYSCDFFNCYFLNGASVERDDISAMCSVLANTVEVWGSAGPKNPGMFRIRTAYAQDRSIEIGALNSRPVWMWNETGTLRVNSDQFTPFEVDLDGVPAAYTAMINVCRSGTVLGAIGHDVDGQLCGLISTLNAPAFTWNDTRDFAGGEGTIATAATTGFLWVPTCAGTPTGVPAPVGIFGQFAPIIVDTTNDKLYFYSGGAWRDAGP